MDRIDVLNSLVLARYIVENPKHSNEEASKFAHGYMIAFTQVMLNVCTTKAEMLEFIERRIKKVGSEVEYLKSQTENVWSI
jgi:hypothetical protein